MSRDKKKQNQKDRERGKGRREREREMGGKIERNTRKRDREIQMER